VRMPVVVAVDVVMKMRIIAVLVLVMVMNMHEWFLRFCYPHRGDMQIYSELYIFIIKLQIFVNVSRYFYYKT
jgi:hypothetical protein